MGRNHGAQSWGAIMGRNHGAQSWGAERYLRHRSSAAQTIHKLHKLAQAPSKPNHARSGPQSGRDEESGGDFRVAPTYRPSFVPALSQLRASFEQSFEQASSPRLRTESSPQRRTRHAEDIGLLQRDVARPHAVVGLKLRTRRAFGKERFDASRAARERGSGDPSSNDESGHADGAGHVHDRSPHRSSRHPTGL